MRLRQSVTLQFRLNSAELKTHIPSESMREQESNLQKEIVENVEIIVLSGKVTLLNESWVARVGGQFRQAASNSVTGKILIDLEAMPYISCGLYGKLIDLRNACIEHGVRLKLCNLSPLVGQIMYMFRGDTVLDLCGTRTQAIASFQLREPSKKKKKNKNKKKKNQKRKE